KRAEQVQRRRSTRHGRRKAANYDAKVSKKDRKSFPWRFESLGKNSVSVFFRVFALLCFRDLSFSVLSCLCVLCASVVRSPLFSPLPAAFLGGLGQFQEVLFGVAILLLAGGGQAVLGQ